VLGAAGTYFKVLRLIVGLDLILVMNLFARPQSATQHLLCYKSMLVGIAPHVGEMMVVSDHDENVPVGSDDTTALPGWTLVTGLMRATRPRRLACSHDVTL